jgi:hypothetical protein
MVATLDVSDFFDNVDAGKVAAVLRCLGFRDAALESAVSLSTFKRRLAQGAPTSSLLANLAFLEVDASIMGLCSRRKLRFSRYVDDIAISGDCDFRELRGPFINRIEAAGYPVAAGKVEFIGRDRRQVVTGLVVNDVLRPLHEYVREVRSVLEICRARGVSFAADLEGKRPERFRESVEGRIRFIERTDIRSACELRRLWFPIGLQRSDRARPVG